MRAALTPKMVATLARSAGFEFTLERCELLAPQLDWLLAQSELLAGLSLAAEEPVLVFRLDAQRAVNPASGEPEHG